MGTEDNGNEKAGAEFEVSPENKSVPIWVSKGYKVFPHFGNAFYANTYAVVGERVERLKPITHYEEFLREDTSVLEQEYNEVVQFSDSATVRAINEIIDRFNADLGRIKQEKDFATAKQLLDELQRLVNEKK